ncbi:MAG TPA: zf-HC2 domain-containing protein [Gemmatimonadales bacterium]
MDYPSGWTCERTALQFEPYLLGTLLLAQALAVAEHLEACPGCAERLIVYRLTITERTHG